MMHGDRPELLWLPVERLDVDDAYQRSLETPKGKKLVAKIAAEFDWRKFGALLATPGGADAEGPRWWLIDGQHRAAGAQAHGGIPEVPAVVFPASSRAEQAQAFIGANRDRVAVTVQALFRARLAAGEVAAMSLAHLCETAGITLLGDALSVRKTPAGQTSAIPALEQAVRVYGEAATGRAIAALGRCFGRFQGGLRGPFFLAAARFLAEGGEEAGLCRALTVLGPERLAAARALGDGGSPALAALLRAHAEPRARAQTIPERAEAVEPERKPLEAHAEAVDRAGGSSEADARQSGGCGSAAPSVEKPAGKPVSPDVARRGAGGSPAARAARGSFGGFSSAGRSLGAKSRIAAVERASAGVAEPAAEPRQMPVPRGMFAAVVDPSVVIRPALPAAVKRDADGVALMFQDDRQAIGDHGSSGHLDRPGAGGWASPLSGAVPS